MSSKKNKKNNAAITARLTEQLENENENVSAAEAAPTDEPGEKDTERFIRTIQSLEASPSDEYEDTYEEEAEAAEEPAEEVRVSRPNRFYLVFAIFIIIMSLIGIFSTVSFIAGKISSIADQTALKEEIALFIYPVVTVDPPDFATAGEIPASVVIESAIWKIILTGDNTNYEKLYNTSMYVPAVDVEFSARSLFGTEAVIRHMTVGNVGSSFTYEEEKNSYLVPISPRFTAYSPSVTDVSNVGELYTVRVEYMPPAALTVKGINLQSSSTKTMEYTLSKSKTSMTIHSAKNITSIGDTYEY